jgi:hypothetical protein
MIKQRLKNVGVISVCLLHCLFLLTTIAPPILTVTGFLESKTYPDVYSDEVTVTCHKKFASWSTQEIEAAHQKCEGSLDFRPGLTMTTLLCEMNLPQRECGNVFDGRIITTQEKRLLKKYTISDRIFVLLLPYWWFAAVGFLLSWIFIYIVFGTRSLNPLATIRGLLKRIS